MNISKLQSQYTTEELQKLAAALSVEELTIIFGGIRPGVIMRPKWKGSSTVM